MGDLGLRDIYEAYLTALDAANGVDFPGMISKFIELLHVDAGVSCRFHRIYRHVLVDEGQDLTKAQAELLRLLVGEELHLFVVADPRQSIHGWAGGSIEWARRLVGDQARELTLVHNFRCATRILALASRVASNFASHRNDAVAPPGAPPGAVAVSSAEHEVGEARLVGDWIDGLLRNGLDEATLVEGESAAVAPEEIAVIARSRFALDVILSELGRREVQASVRTDSDTLLATAEARLLHGLVQLKLNPRDQPAVRRVREELEYWLQTGLDEELFAVTGGDFSIALVESEVAGSFLAPAVRAVITIDDSPDGLERLISAIDAVDGESEEWTQDAQRLREWWRSYRTSTRLNDRSLRGFLLYLYQVQRTRPHDPGIRLLTAHRAKGLEFRAVAVIGLTQGAFPDYRNIERRQALEEERRAFYVAVTRASRVLFAYMAAIPPISLRPASICRTISILS